jgi:hypothetical protein
MNSASPMHPYGQRTFVNASDEGPRKLVLTIGGQEVSLHDLDLVDPYRFEDRPCTLDPDVPFIPFHSARTQPAESDVSPPTIPPVECAAAAAPRQTFFLIQRQNGHWSPGAKIIAVYEDQGVAEAAAILSKKDHPQQHYGIASLFSEALPVANPVEIVRVVT